MTQQRYAPTDEGPVEPQVTTVREQIDCEQQEIDRRVYDKMNAKAAIVPDVVHGRTPKRMTNIP